LSLSCSSSLLLRVNRHSLLGSLLRKAIRNKIILQILPDFFSRKLHSIKAPFL
jgi:hypothetical protein